MLLLIREKAFLDNFLFFLLDFSILIPWSVYNQEARTRSWYLSLARNTAVARESWRRKHSGYQHPSHRSEGKRQQVPMDNLPPRNKSQRLIDKRQKQSMEQHRAKKAMQSIKDPKESDLCVGLNEITDSFHAFPQDVISYFTLLKEIEAKCVYTVPHLRAYIKRFLTMRKTHAKRGLLLSRIRECIKELMPCLEEKMHVATIASDQVRKHVSKIDQAYEIVVNHEIPEIVRVGPMWEPCMKVSEPKTLHQQRSESRREALAAKKAKHGGDDEFEHTAGEESADTGKKSARSKKESKAGAASGAVHGSGNGAAGGTANGGHGAHSSGAKKRRHNAGDEEYGSARSHVSNGNGSSQSKNAVGNGSGHGGNSRVSSTSNGNAGVPHKKGKTSKAKKEGRKDGGNSNGKTHLDNDGGASTTKSRNGKAQGATAADHHEHNPRGSKTKKEQDKKQEEPASPINYEGEPVYCYCQQVSYGEMVGCDGEHCEKEWFHLPCTGLKELPKGEWYCDDCKSKMVSK